MRQAPFGIRTGRSARTDFFLGTGTALSPGLVFLVTQAVSTVLATGTGTTRRVGLTGLAILGAGFTIGALAEPVTYSLLRKPFARPVHTIVALGNVAWPIFMALASIRAL